MIKLSMPEIQALIAPLATPLPSAVTASAVLYRDMKMEEVPWVIALVVASIAFVGIESIGGVSVNSALSLHRMKIYNAEFYLSLAGIFVYIAVGTFILWGSKTAILLLLVPFSYVGYSVLRGVKERVEERTKEVESQTDYINAETRRLNAEIRKEKLQLNRNVTNMTDSLSQSVTHVNDKRRMEKEEKLKEVVLMLNDNPNVTNEEIAKKLGVTVRSVIRYRKEI